MAWFDPLNNSGGVSFDFFDFTYLSIPPIGNDGDDDHSDDDDDDDDDAAR